MKAYGMGPTVDVGSVACPTCERGKGLPCAKRGGEGWGGASRRYHPARITAAIKARQKREEAKRESRQT